ALDAVLHLFPRLRERLSNRGGTLSGGEQQMLAIGRALIANPQLLLMDEPTEGLSPYVVEEIKQLILRLKQSGLSILLVEQNVELAVGEYDLVYVMDKGRIVCSATPTELMANEPMMETYLGIAVKWASPTNSARPSRIEFSSSLIRAGERARIGVDRHTEHAILRVVKT